MKRLIAFVLAAAMLLTGCVQAQPSKSNSTTTPTVGAVEWKDDIPTYTSLNDTQLLAHVEDLVYRETVVALDSEEYFVENVSAVYISKEYLDELAFNSQSNIYFGYTLAELDELFEGSRYVFTLGEDGETTVKPLEEVQDTSTETMLKNVAIGTGVILVCVTVSAVSAGVGAPAISMIFAASAKTGSMMALSSGAFGGISAAILKGIEIGDFDEALKAGALAASEGFKWGAISGAIAGGASEAIALKGATCNGLTMNEAAIIQKESGFPLDVIKQFQTMGQYNICKNAGLTTKMVNGKTALIRNIDLNFTDEYGLTNLQRMQAGNAPLDATGIPYELHHVGQKTDSTLAILTRAEHRQGGNHQIWHYVGEATDNPSSQAGWQKIKEDFWKTMAKMLEGA